MSRQPSKSLVALLYHGLVDAPWKCDYIKTTDFEAQLAWLEAEKFAMEGVDSLEDRLATDRFPERYVTLTFDDGHRSNMLAAELLCRSRARATFFLVRDACESGDGRYLSPADVKELASIQHVGSHSISHRDLTRLSPAELRAELADSKAWLEDLTGRRVNALSAPQGRVNRRVVDAALEANYAFIATGMAWWNDPSDLERHHTLNRVSIRHGVSLRNFEQACYGNAPFMLRQAAWSTAIQALKSVTPLPLVRRMRRLLYSLRVSG